ncbi:MAG: acetate--CoA ligase family protein [Candidatus Thorarchaeota archaeon]
MNWKIDSLHHLFNPRNIAVVGASDKPERLGALALLALRGFEGNTFPVNPRISKIGNAQCYASITAIPVQIDLALICVREVFVPQALLDAAQANVPSVIIFAAGYKELGPEGEKEQQRIKQIVDDAKIAVVGPNCLGAGNINLNLNATFFPHPIPVQKGRTAIVSQSGGVCGSMLYSAVDSNLGISKFVSVGNRVNIDFHDLLQFFRDDSETSVICLFIEGTELGREMYQEMLLTTPKKPVLVFKVGKTPVSRQAALSHTGSLAGQPEIYSAAVKQAGGLEVDSIQDMMDTAKILSMTSKRAQSKRVGIITHTLGLALIVAQTLEEKGAILPMPPQETQRKIDAVLDMPIEMEIKNPVDLLAKAWAEPKVFASAFEILMNDDTFDTIVTVFAPNFQEGIGGGMPVREIINSSENSDKLVISIMNAPVGRIPPGQVQLEEAGIPVFASPQRAARALANVIRLSIKHKTI